MNTSSGSRRQVPMNNKQNNEQRVERRTNEWNGEQRCERLTNGTTNGGRIPPTPHTSYIRNHHHLLVVTTSPPPRTSDIITFTSTTIPSYRPCHHNHNLLLVPATSPHPPITITSITSSYRPRATTSRRAPVASTLMYNSMGTAR